MTFGVPGDRLDLPPEEKKQAHEYADMLDKVRFSEYELVLLTRLNMEAGKVADRLGVDKDQLDPDGVVNGAFELLSRRKKEKEALTVWFKMDMLGDSFDKLGLSDEDLAELSDEETEQTRIEGILRNYHKPLPPIEEIRNCALHLIGRRSVRIRTKEQLPPEEGT
ncbi:hypothetical protein ACFL21_01500 [Patescibacteria group bacterium]